MSLTSVEPIRSSQSSSCGWAALCWFRYRQWRWPLLLFTSPFSFHPFPSLLFLSIKFHSHLSPFIFSSPHFIFFSFPFLIPPLFSLSSLFLSLTFIIFPSLSSPIVSFHYSPFFVLFFHYIFFPHLSPFPFFLSPHHFLSPLLSSLYVFQCNQQYFCQTDPNPEPKIRVILILKDIFSSPPCRSSSKKGAFTLSSSTSKLIKFNQKLHYNLDWIFFLLLFTLASSSGLPLSAFVFYNNIIVIFCILVDLFPSYSNYPL